MIYIGERTGLTLNDCIANSYNIQKLSNVKLSPLYRKIIMQLLFSKRIDAKLFNGYNIEKLKRKFYKMKNIEEFNVFCYVNNIALQVGINNQYIKVYKFENEKYDLVNSQQISSYKLSNISYNKFCKLCSFNDVEVKEIDKMIESNNILSISEKDQRVTELKLTNNKKINNYNRATQARKVYSVKDENFKAIQRKINTYLNLLQIPSEDLMCSFAYQKGKSYKDYLAVHCGANVLFKTDISEFFDSIDVNRLEQKLKAKLGVNKLNEKLNQQELTKDVKKIENRLSDREKIVKVILSYSTLNYANKERIENRIAQGFITSPALSNIYMEEFDKKVSKWAINLGFKYSRYCDDIIISSSVPVSETKILEDISQFCQEEGLKLNSEKTKIMDTVLKVSNVIIGEELSLPNRYYRSIYNVLVVLLNEENKDIKKKKINDYLKNNSKERSNLKYKPITDKDMIFLPKKVKTDMKKKDYIYPFLQYLKGKLEYAININPYKVQIARCLKIYDQATRTLYPNRNELNIGSVPFKLSNSVSDSIKILINKREIKYIPIIIKNNYYTLELEVKDIKAGIEVLLNNSKEKAYFNYTLVDLDRELIYCNSGENKFKDSELKVEHYIGEEAIYYDSKMIDSKLEKIEGNLYRKPRNSDSFTCERIDDKVIFSAVDYNMFFLSLTKQYFDIRSNVELGMIKKQRQHYYCEEKDEF